VSCALAGSSRAMQAPTCATAHPICTQSPYTSPAAHNTMAEVQPDYSCAGVFVRPQRNPSWFYIKIGVAGDLSLRMSQAEPDGSPVDVDFLCWGPFTSPTAPCTAELNATNLIDCSYSISATEICYIPSALVGEYYIIVLTTYSQDESSVTFSQAGGSGATDCAVMDDIYRSYCSPFDPTINPTGDAIPCPCGSSGVTADPGHGCGNSVYSGGAKLSATGICDATSNDAFGGDTVVFTVIQLPPGTIGILLRGETNIAPGVPFNAGVRCIGVLQRLEMHADTPSEFPPGVAFDGQLQFGFGCGDNLGVPDEAIHAAGGDPSGVTRGYQVWYRNPAAFCGSAPTNVSQAIEFTWW